MQASWRTATAQHCDEIELLAGVRIEITDFVDELARDWSLGGEMRRDPPTP